MENENIFINVKLLHGPVANYNPERTSDDAGKLFFATEADSRSYLYLDNGTSRFNIVPKLLTVVNGGTGTTTFTAGEALIGNGTDAVSTRSILNNTTATFVEASNSLITAGTLAFWNGAYDNTGLSNITCVGTITKGVWKGTTIAVNKGGTGATTFTKYGVLYGNGTSAIKATAKGTQGQILSPDANGVPSFADPSFTWLNGLSNGTATNDASNLTLRFSLQGKNYDIAIPIANCVVNDDETETTTPGIITTGTQRFKGSKTFNDYMYTNSIQPITASDKTFGSDSVPWGNIFTNKISFMNTNGTIKLASLEADSENNTGILTLGLGDDTSYKGYIKIYNDTGASSTIDTKAEDDREVSIPNHNGNFVLSHTTDWHPESYAVVNYRLPFYTTSKEIVGDNDGYTIDVQQGTRNSTGKMILTLGNIINAAEAEGGKYGAVKLYGSQSDSFTIMPYQLDANSETIKDYCLYLPAPVTPSSAGELLYHSAETQIGDTNHPVYITSGGQALEINQTSVLYGGTGLAAITENGVMYGLGANQETVGVTAAGSQGQILSPNADNVPSFATPSFSWPNNNTTNKQPFLRMTLQGKTWDSPIIPLASTSQSGIVTIADQSFKGLKTFTTGVKVSASTTSSNTTTGALVVTGGTGIGGALNVGSNAVISGDMHVYGGNFYLGTSNAATGRIRMTYAAGDSGDTLTILFND